jgi:hypothetical protein
MEIRDDIFGHWEIRGLSSIDERGVSVVKSVVNIHVILVDILNK